jgi:hypothetical protein
MELSLRDMPFGMGAGAGCGRAGERRRIERFWLRSINRGNRLLAASGFKERQCNGSPDVSS